MSEHICELTPIDSETWDTTIGEEIVRCRDCKHRRRSWNGHHPNFIDHFFCAYTGGHEVKPDGFCAWGERK